MQSFLFFVAGAVTCLVGSWLAMKWRKRVATPPSPTVGGVSTMKVRSGGGASLSVARSSSDLEARRSLVQLAAWAVEGGATEHGTHAGGILIDAASVDASDPSPRIADQFGPGNAQAPNQDVGSPPPSHSPIAASHYRALAEELGYAADTVAVQSNRLLEAYGDSTQFTFRSQDLWSAVEKLQRFHRKLQGLGTDGPPRLEATPIEPILRRVQRHAEASGTFRVTLQTGRAMPPVLANESQLRDGLSFLVDALSHTDTADQLEITATTDADEMQCVCVEFMIDCPARPAAAEPRLQPDEADLDFRTAENLLHGMGAVVTVENQPGFRTCVSVDLPALNVTENDSAPTVAQVEDDVVIPLVRPSEPSPNVERDREEPEVVRPEAPLHAFGGALVLDRDPAIRNMIASELRAMEDRPVMTCADGEAAKALLEATPERFELLVLERSARLVSGDSLAMESLAQNPAVKVILLTRRPDPLAALPSWEPLLQNPSIARRMDTLRKPPATATLQATLRRMLRLQIPNADADQGSATESPRSVPS